jgi:heme exporter protein C
VVTAVCGVLYLWREDEKWDRLAIAGAEVGVIFCSLMIITGPIWAKGTWGKWWSWDPRLTVTLLLWFVYLAYLLLRNFSEGGSRTARFAAVYGLVGAALIPLNYFVIEIFGGRGMHPENLERGSLGDGMGIPFLLGNLTLFVAFCWLVLVRWEVENLRARSLARFDDPMGRTREEIAS